MALSELDEGVITQEEYAKAIERQAEINTQAIEALISQALHRQDVESRLDELESFEDCLTLEAREAGACDAIHKRANELRDKLKENI